ncbi:MAG: DUF1801 domain-containing protein [Pirellulaceae bacterium]|nr:DUF1801 domain-containing protein [Pirellulaceae bacterium]
MQSQAKTVSHYVKELPPERRDAIEAVRKIILKNLPQGYEEGMQYGMIGYYVPHSIYPSGYHCDPSQPLPFAHLASQKNYMAIYMLGLYADPKVQEWFISQWQATGKKLDMGKSCIRFKSLDDLPLKLIGRAIKKVSVKKLIRDYEAAIDPKVRQAARQERATKKSSRKTAPAKKVAKKRIVKKK